MDPVKAPLVRKVFELYATARFNLKILAEEAYRLGLRNRSGNRISLNGLATIFHNPFYMGVIHISTTNETFSGIHPPLISSLLFKRVQLVLAGKFNGRAQVHDFLFRCLLRCATCNYSLVGELQKGHVYYRCHTDSCPVTNVRQEAVEHEFLTKLDLLQQSPEERRHVLDRIANMKKDWVQQRAAQIKGVQLSLSQVTDRLNRLTDAFIDVAIDKQLFEERKTALLEERLHWSEQIAGIDSGESLPEKLANRLELAGRAYLSYKLGIPEEKRNLLRIVTSNRTVSGKNVILKLNSFFDEVANRFQYACGSPYRDVPRTMDTLILRLSDILSKQQAP